MCFTSIPDVPMLQIMEMLSIGNRYNISVVWPEFGFWGPMPKSPDLLTRIESQDTAHYIIDNVCDLELAAVLASTGQFEPVDKIFIENLNLSDVPSNLIRNLMAIIRCEVILNRVEGLKFQMMDCLNCEVIHISNSTIPYQETIKISVKRWKLSDISGDVKRSVLPQIMNFLTNMNNKNII